MARPTRTPDNKELRALEAKEKKLAGFNMSYEKEAEFQEASLKRMDEQARLTRQALDDAQKRFALEEKRLSKEKEGTVEYQKQVEELAKASKELADQEKKYLDIGKAADKVLEKQKETHRLMQKSSSVAGKLMASFFGIEESNTKLEKGLGKNLKLFYNIQKSMLKIASIQNVLSSGFKAMGTAVLLTFKAIEETSASLASLTGRGREFSGVLMNAAMANRTFGITIAEQGQALEGLFTSFTGFTDLTRSSQRELAAFSARMAVLGVDSGVTGQNFDFLTKALGMTSSKAKMTQIRLVDLAAQLGRPVRELVSDFAQLAPQLAIYGARSIKIFTKLSAQSKALGVSTSDLNSAFGSQLDTFEGAASAAGKLNSVLGKDLISTTRLLYADPAERLNIIRSAVLRSGKDFKTMSKFERIMIMNAAGIKDASMAMKVFGQSAEELEIQRIRAEQASAAQAKFNKRLAPTRTLMKRLQVAFQNLAIAVTPILNKVLLPTVNFLVKISDKIAKFISTSEGMKTLKAVFIGLGTVIATFFIAPFLKVSAIVTAISAAIAYFTGKFSGFTSALKSIGSDALSLVGGVYTSLFGGGGKSTAVTSAAASKRTAASAAVASSMTQTAGAAGSTGNQTYTITFKGGGVFDSNDRNFQQAVVGVIRDVSGKNVRLG